MVGERVSELRKRKNMTQKQLADYLCISLNSVSLYERNLSTPDDQTKVKLAQLFNVSMDYLMGTSDKQTPLHQKESGSLFVYCENLSPDAHRELSSFLKLFKEKYGL